MQGQTARMTRFNQSFRWEVTPAIEYSVLPYEEATRRALTFGYKVGPAYRDYLEETIVGETSELRVEESLEVELSQRQRWSDAGLTLLIDLQQRREQPLPGRQRLLIGDSCSRRSKTFGRPCDRRRTRRLGACPSNGASRVGSATAPDPRRRDERVAVRYAEERQQRKRRCAAPTPRARGGCGAILRQSSSPMLRHRIRRSSLSGTRKPLVRGRTPLLGQAPSPSGGVIASQRPRHAGPGRNQPFYLSLHPRGARGPRRR